MSADRFSALIADIAARVDGEPAIATWSRRAIEIYTPLLETRNVEAMLDALLPGESEEARYIATLALVELGVCIANIVREEREPPGQVKPRLAWQDDVKLSDCSPRWREPISGHEDGAPALIVPVAAGSCGWIGGLGYTLSCWRLSDDDFFAGIADLIALPLDGGRPLSLLGHTVAVGFLRADERGRMVVHASGKVWLEAHMRRAIEATRDWPAHLVSAQCMPFDEPDKFGILVLEPRALEWRVTRPDCAIPEEAREIVCPDSRKLAELIDTAMRRKERTRPLPVVRGPQTKTERAAA
ncbi:MAG TPA: hypothetical protein VGM17_02415 [Rhizomicrobium sp.]|jgi:hypothetical protein